MKRGKDLTKLTTVTDALAALQRLLASYRGHSLRADRAGFRGLHIEPDWLPIYRVKNDELQLVRTGTHADLFDEWLLLKTTPRSAPCARESAPPPGRAAGPAWC
ncbi:MAG TPA: type II toxin-antitoxin system YafQ family toxin [Roseiarcus sp.]|nr:type II toxin-antitoxin system YafQ family toxin [Roseiarcus sp.]